MSESNELVIVEPKNALTVFTEPDEIEAILLKVEREVSSFVSDVSTKKGRDAIGSLGLKIARTKTYLDGLGKNLVDEYKEVPKKIDANRKTVRDRLDDLKAKILKPREEWEAEKERILAEEEAKAEAERYSKMRDDADKDNAAFDLAKAKELALQIEADHATALLDNYEYDRDIAEKKAEAERQRITHEEELKRQAVEQAQREANEKIQREREASAKREADLKAQADQEKRDREAADRKAEQDKIDAAAKAEREKQEAIAAEQLKAQQKEDARLAEERRIADEAAARAADVAHRKTIGTDIVNDLLANAKIDRVQAIQILTALKDGNIRHTTIHY